jgi:hypothetical protein
MAVTGTAMTNGGMHGLAPSKTVMPGLVPYLHDVDPHRPLILTVIPAKAGIQYSPPFA